jgi:carbonic anhydrase
MRNLLSLNVSKYYFIVYGVNYTNLDLKIGITVDNFGEAMFLTRICYFCMLCVALAQVALAGDTLKILKEGNQRFVNNEVKCEDVTKAKRMELAKDQSPIATLIVCSDSRVAPELVFDQQLGKLFVIRLAGNVVDQLALGTIEFGLSVLKTPLVIVMGHQNCGAVKAAFSLGETDFSANIGTLLTQISPAVKKVKMDKSQLSKDDQLNLAIQMNVANTHKQMILRSPIIRDFVKEGKVEIVDAVFHIDSGKVEWGPFVNP